MFDIVHDGQAARNCRDIQEDGDYGKCDSEKRRVYRITNEKNTRTSTLRTIMRQFRREVSVSRRLNLGKVARSLGGEMCRQTCTNTCRENVIEITTQAHKIRK